MSVGPPSALTIVTIGQKPFGVLKQSMGKSLLNVCLASSTVTIGQKPFGVLKRGRRRRSRLYLQPVLTVTIGQKPFGVLKRDNKNADDAGKHRRSLSGKNPSGY